MNIATTLTTLAAIVGGAVGVDTQSQPAVKAVIAASVALVVAVHSLVTALDRRHANTSAVKIAQAKAGGASTPPPAPAPTTGLSYDADGGAR